MEKRNMMAYTIKADVSLFESVDRARKENVILQSRAGWIREAMEHYLYYYEIVLIPHLQEHNSQISNLETPTKFYARKFKV